MSLNFGFIQNTGGSSDKFLPISGGTMSGDIDMDNNDITNVGSAVVDETYTRDEYTDDITVVSTLTGGVIGDALTLGDIGSVREFELNLSLDTSDLAPGFFIYGHALALFGRFNNLSGYVERVSLKVVKPTNVGLNNKLTSVQMYMSSEDTPKTLSKSLSPKLTKDLIPGTHNVPVNTTKFSNLKYFAFFFEGGDGIIQTKFTATVVLKVV